MQNGTHWFALVHKGAHWFTLVNWCTMVHIGGTGGGCRRQLKVCFSSWWELWEEYRTRKLGAGRKVKSKDKEKTKKYDKKKKIIKVFPDSAVRHSVVWFPNPLAAGSGLGERKG